VAEIVSAAVSGRHNEEYGDGRSSTMNALVVCSLDLLSATCWCLPDESVVRFTAQFRLLPRLFTTLAAQSLDQEVRFVHNNNDMAPTDRHDKPPPPSVGRGARFAVAQGHTSGLRIGSLKCPCRTSYW